MIPAAAWDRYRKLINEAHNDFNQDVITWVRGNFIVTQFQEQEEPSGNRVDLKVLIGYNFFRTWPITKNITSGELDNQNMLVHLNKDYLEGLGHLTPKGYFNFKPDKDYFIHRGIRYKAEGDTFLSQAHNDPLHIQLILHREEVLTGENRYDNPETQGAIIEVQEDILYLVNNDIH